MDKSDKDIEYPLEAVLTVARYAGLATDEVLSLLCSKQAGHEQLQASGLHKHIRAIETVCRFAGIDMQEMCARLAQRRQIDAERKHELYKRVA